MSAISSNNVNYKYDDKKISINLKNAQVNKKGIAAGILVLTSKKKHHGHVDIIIKNGKIESMTPHGDKKFKKDCDKEKDEIKKLVKLMNKQFKA